MTNIHSLKELRVLVIDDHESVLGGTLDVLTRQYPEAEFLTAQTVQGVLNQVEEAKPDLVVMDLSIPEKPGISAKVDTGIQLLKALMKKYSTLNIVVQSTYIRALVRIIPDIDAHKGGFTAADKSLSSKEMLN
ncbi:MAG TPA: response regulator, partial [Candidatus Sericytochromatia bacterium]